MTRQECISLMESVKGEVSPILRKKIEEILTLAEQYRSIGKDFTFGLYPDLDKKINDLLIELSDELIGIYETKVLQVAEEEDRDAVLAYVRNGYDGVTLTESVDRYSSQLKAFMEAYVAIEFANKMNKTDVLREILTFIDNPYISPMFRGAISKDFAATALLPGGLRIGAGHTKSVLDGFILIGQGAINEAFQLQTVWDYRKDAKIIGYRVHRGSSYDCGYCDSLCAVVHPLDEIVIPAHARCHCYTTPVYEEGGD